MLIQNKMILRRLFEELFNQGDLGVVDELIAATYLNHSAPREEEAGREGLKQLIRQLHAAFHDLYFVIEEQIAEGHKVVTRWTATGIHQDAFAGIPATGKHISITAISIHRVTDGQIQESWLNWDVLDTLSHIARLQGEKQACMPQDFPRDAS